MSSTDIGYAILFGVIKVLGTERHPPEETMHWGRHNTLHLILSISWVRLEVGDGGVDSACSSLVIHRRLQEEFPLITMFLVTFTIPAHPDCIDPCYPHH
jgi:hypothetical protein